MSVAAILCSDIHLSHNAPAFRSDEPNWYAAMRRPLEELKSLAEKYDVPVVCGGDVVDSWDSNAELINFALQHLVRMYAVAGNHDTPDHRWEDIHRSAYWTLVEAGRIKNITPGKPVEIGQLVLHGFPHGFEPKPLNPKERHSLGLHVAVVHKYIWTKQTGFHDAPEDARLKNLNHLFEGYDAVLVGDNHQGFLAGKVFNAGTFFRRRSDERDYSPCVGLLHDTGKIEKHFLDCSKDIYLTSAKEVLEGISEGLNEGVVETEDLFSSMEELSSSKIDFEEYLKEKMLRDKVDPEVEQIVLGAVPNE